MSYPRTSFDFVLDCYLIFLPCALLNEGGRGRVGEGRGGGMHDSLVKASTCHTERRKTKREGTGGSRQGGGVEPIVPIAKKRPFFYYKVTTKLLKTEDLCLVLKIESECLTFREQYHAKIEFSLTNNT